MRLERLEFDVKLEVYRLSREASALRSVTGTVGGAPYTFQQTIDYDLIPPDAVAWLPGGKRPDDNTSFFVDYLVPGSASPLSDTNVGSVTRTLSEAIGREIATVYEQYAESPGHYGSQDAATATRKVLAVKLGGSP